jgi:uncharacterized protein YmfQ (DUF2313 family)
MRGLRDNETTTSAVAEETRAVARRKAPKSDERLLAEAEKRTGVLHARVLANRDRQRMELVEDLYRQYSVEPVVADVSERKRLATLRARLSL